MLLVEMDFLYDDKIRNEIEREKNNEEKIKKKMDVIKKLFDISSEKKFQDFLTNLHNDCFIFGEKVGVFKEIVNLQRTRKTAATTTRICWSTVLMGSSRARRMS